jgi:deazaflavin-dependent oxidoreductase (nitroreductase family)
MSSVSNWNQQVIAEFRANGGRVGGRHAGRPILLLHSVGARSGQTRVHPVTYQQVGDRFAIFASKNGAPTNPDWYHNLRANPRATVEVGTNTFAVNARVAQGQEREEIWARQKQQYPNFADYEKQTARQIPVIILERDA